MKELLPKQKNAVWYLENKDAQSVSEVLFGGAAGAGKSDLIAVDAISFASKNHGARLAFGRSEIKNLKLTTVRSFIDVANKLGVYFKYSENSDRIVLPQYNAEIFLVDLKFYPGKDPEFAKLGSLQISRAYVDESAEITRRALDIFKSRVRYKLNEFDKVPKMLMTCNPAPGHLFEDFYEPWKNKKLRTDRAFVRALPKDNKYLPESYLRTLLTLNESDKQRLYYGNWEFQNDPFWLITSYTVLADMTTKVPTLSQNPNNRFITCDAARLGKDEAVIMVWDGWNAIHCIVFDKCTIPEQIKEIKRLQGLFNVKNSNTIVDQDGVGGGVVDGLGCLGFTNNAAPFPRIDTNGNHKLDFNGDYLKENFGNLKSQCAWYLANKINNFEVSTSKLSEEINSKIKKELQVLKQKNTLDGKRYLISKDQMKVILNISPGFLDAMLMRSHFDLMPIQRGVSRLN